MKLFGKKKNKNKATPTKSAWQGQPHERGVGKQPQTTVVKYVGESKHVITNTVDALGRQVSQTEIIQLTTEEMEELGIVPKTSSTTTITTSAATTSNPVAMSAAAPQL